MSKPVDRSTVTEAAPEAFRRLPEAIRVEDTVTSIRGDSIFDHSGDDNALIAAALKAGG
ncbi:hypothetical protein G7072_03615 [Nocardioides sp. HDW12B]|uniref:hypothetical protein n=1 Tax=Nocardioides sp. HDW12B TaxID=2714939 RepID=UPI0014073112|nr:hypothetical protein [Nocardioides sp. HDW12B]QIK65545.1 hypothetical protein G7072_03615 [Nocardioides sp. HDW12B]